MNTDRRYEIFRKRPDQVVEWIERATSLAGAKDRLRRLAGVSAGEFFILDAEKAHIIFPRVDSCDRDLTSAPKTESVNGIRNPAEQTSGDARTYVPPRIQRVCIAR